MARALEVGESHYRHEVADVEAVGRHVDAVVDGEPLAGQLLPEGVVGDGVPAFTVRPGYRVTLVAKDLGEARFLAFDEAGTLYVSQPKEGAILSLKDTDSDRSFEEVAPFITDNPRAQAMQFKDGWLWFATSGGIYRAKEGWVALADTSRPLVEPSSTTTIS